MPDHPITPPPELVQRWIEKYGNSEDFRWQTYECDIATQAARWGADQELEACCKYMQHEDFHGFATELRAARRLKPPSLKEQALQAAQRFYAKGHENCTDEEIKDDFDTIRRALEQLDG